MTSASDLGSFGRLGSPPLRSVSPNATLALFQTGKAAPDSLLPFGNGRSYGDSCHNEAGRLVDMRSMSRILGFDAQSGVIEVEAGALLSDVIDHAAPHGWFPAVTPGTRFVTVGGAIANDVHGKNHHRRGTFGHHVESLVLARSDGSVRRCSGDENADLFRATVGGMGLTGIILSARVRLMEVGSLNVIETTTPFASLDAFFDICAQAEDENEYVVAWIDQLARGAGMGRGVLLAGNHADDGHFTVAKHEPRLSVPFSPPFCVLGRPFLKVFNAAYRLSKSQSHKPHNASWQSFFYPLDAIGHWNRLYGPKGLYQHQSVVPEDVAREAIADLLSAAEKAGQGSFLTVLKRFGAMAQPGLLSFARSGYTLTLDFPNRGAETARLMAELDRITVSAGGAVNPYKDARMSAETFAASFTDWPLLEALRDPALSSDFWRRTALSIVDPVRVPVLAAE